VVAYSIACEVGCHAAATEGGRQRQWQDADMHATTVTVVAQHWPLSVALMKSSAMIHRPVKTPITAASLLQKTSRFCRDLYGYTNAQFLPRDAVSRHRVSVPVCLSITRRYRVLYQNG